MAGNLGAGALRLGYLGASFYPDGSPSAWGLDSRLAVELAVRQLGSAATLIRTHETNGTVDGLAPVLDEWLAAGVEAVIGADWCHPPAN